jgi:site-specific recombinase XerD
LLATGKDPYRLTYNDIETNDDCLLNFVREEKGYEDASDKERADIDDYYRYLIYILREFYNSLRRSNIIEQNIFDLVEPAKTPVELKRKHLTDEEIEEIEKKIIERFGDYSEFLCAFYLGRYAGLRSNEIVMVRKGDLKKTKEGFLSVFVTEGKGKAQRQTLIFEKRIIEWLEEYMKVNRITSDDALLVPFNVNTLWIYAYRITEELKNEGKDIHFTMHKLRHTYTKKLIDMGIELPYVQYLLGHKSIKTTAIYFNIDIEKTSEKVFEKLKGGEGGLFEK